MRTRNLTVAAAGTVMMMAVASCGARRDEADRLEPKESFAVTLLASPDARARLADIRDRFRVRSVRPDASPNDALQEPLGAPEAPVLGSPVVTGFVSSGGSRVRAAVSPVKAGTARTASVELPDHANGIVRVEDDLSHLHVGFALRGAAPAPITVADGMVLYRGGLDGADVVHRVQAEGTEDFIVFEVRPAREELAYDVDVSSVAGLRLVANTLEFLDDSGVPRLRVAPPFVVDADGARSAATLAVDGCSVDRNPAAPQGRPVTRPDQKSCVVGVAWKAAAYPAIVDPSWVATGSMATPRYYHASTLLSSGKVLVAGGLGASAALSSAELYDPTTGTFASTGAMASARYRSGATALSTGNVLLAGGWNSSTLASAEVYNAIAGTFASTGAMTTARYRHSATRLASGKVLVAGGVGSAGRLAGAELYDPTSGTFAPTGSMNDAREDHTATRLDTGKVLVAGGREFPPVTWAELYDPTTETFAQTGFMASERTKHTATLLSSGKVLITAGSGNGPTLRLSELFDPATGTFSATGSLVTARTEHSAALLGSGKVLVLGGSALNSSIHASAELFDPSGSGIFSTSASMAVARTNATATVLSSGKVLVVGGDSPTGIQGSAELYDIAANGATCAAGDECVSGICEGAVCCSGPCGGTCKTCAPGTGACVAVTNADDPNTCSGANTCDASGACKKQIGQTCPGGDGECATGNCVDGICCNTACGGSCDVCAASLGATADGTCTPAPTGSAGNPACGNGFACNGTSVTCAGSCSSDFDCLGADYCAADATCQPRKAQGAACDAAADADCKVGACRNCESGHCVDGVCCDTACDTLCQACRGTLKESGMNDGVCDHAKAQTNPHNDACPVAPPETCGQDGLCSGAGACALYYPPGTSCGASACVAGNKAAGELCDGAGICASDPGGVSCGEFLCANGSCPIQCSLDTDCVASAFCDQSTCLAKLANGATCTEERQCASDQCADGVRCNTACAGQCEACNGDETAGTCTPVVGAPVAPRAACPTGNPEEVCAVARCDGETTTSCEGFTAPSVSCREASCKDAVQKLSATCDGDGACPAAATKSCEPYVCSGAACGTSCASDKDCTHEYRCETASGKCISGATCDGRHTITSSEGETDCSPYNCEGTSCRTTCGTVDDCVSPNVCDAHHRCVAPSAGATGGTGDESGCSMAPLEPGRATSRGAPVLLLALGLALPWIRRRRAARRCLS